MRRSVDETLARKIRWIGLVFFLWMALVVGSQAIATEAEDWFQRGNRFSQEGLWMEAIEAYKRSIGLNSDYWVVHYNLGLAYKRKKMYAKSAEAFEKALKMAPDNLDIRLNLGNVYNYLENWEAAIQNLNLVVHRRQGDAVAHGGLGWALYNYSQGPRFKLLVILNLRTAVEIFESQKMTKPAEATRQTLNEALLAFGMDPAEFDSPL